MIIASRVRGGVHNGGSTSTLSLKTTLLNGCIVVPVVNVVFLFSIFPVVVVCVINRILYVVVNDMVIVVVVVMVVTVAVVGSIRDINI